MAMNLSFATEVAVCGHNASRVVKAPGASGQEVLIFSGDIFVSKVQLQESHQIYSYVTPSTIVQVPDSCQVHILVTTGRIAI